MCLSQVGVTAERIGLVSGMKYDTIRDAILTCARQPTRVSLIYRTEPTTKKCKNRETKSIKQICSEITVNSPGNPCSEYLRRRNEGLQWEGFAEKEGFKPGPILHCVIRINTAVRPQCDSNLGPLAPQSDALTMHRVTSTKI